MEFNPASRAQDYPFFDEFREVDPSITDSSTSTFQSPEPVVDLFEREIEGCLLYSRHFNPTNKCLASALARMEEVAAAQIATPGMGAPSTTLMTPCHAGDEIVCGRTICGGLRRAQESVAALRCQCSFRRPVKSQCAACCN